MAWEWRPETPEEIAEHQRMRRELIESRQMYDDKFINDGNEVQKKNRRPRSVLLIILVVILAIYLLYNGGFTFSRSKYEQRSTYTVTEDQTEYDTTVHYGKSVSKNASKYIQQNKVVTLKWNDLIAKFNTVFQEGSAEVDCAVYGTDIDSLLTEIKYLQEQSIYSFDPLKGFQEVCELFYARIYSFLVTIKQQQKVDSNACVQLFVELKSLENPYDCLVKLFDENGYYYYIDSENWVHYKYQNSIF